MSLADNPLRAQILACFLAPEPTSSRDLRDRAVTVRAVAVFLAGLTDRAGNSWTLAETEAFAKRDAEVRAECEVMYAEKLLDKPHPHIMDHHLPPPDTYTLTGAGEAQAMVVLKVVKEQQEASHAQ